MKIQEEDLLAIGAEPIQLFYDGIRAEATKVSYTRTLKKILCVMLEDILHGTFEERAAELVRKSKADPEFGLSVLLALSRKLKKRTELPKTDPDYMNPSTFAKYLKPLKKLFDMNGVAVVWARVHAVKPEQNNVLQGRGYTIEEIQKALRFAHGAIDIAIILVAASSSIRVGGMKLKWKDLEPVYRIEGKLTCDVTESEVKRAEVVCAILWVYSGTDVRTPSFVTPEAYNALLDYKQTWIYEVGREPKPEDPLFKRQGELPRALDSNGIRGRISRVLQDAGLRTPLPKGKRRHDVPAMNGFRRFMNKVNKETISQDSTLAALIKKEYMMGHTGLTKLDRNYFHAHLFELVEEYLHAVPNLTISDEERTKEENKKLQSKLSDEEKQKQNQLFLEDRIKRQDDILNYFLNKDPEAKKQFGIPQVQDDNQKSD